MVRATDSRHLNDALHLVSSDALGSLRSAGMKFTAEARDPETLWKLADAAEAALARRQDLDAADRHRLFAAVVAIREVSRLGRLLFDLVAEVAPGQAARLTEDLAKVAIVAAGMGEVTRAFRGEAAGVFESARKRAAQTDNNRQAQSRGAATKTSWRPELLDAYRDLVMDRPAASAWSSQRLADHFHERRQTLGIVRLPGRETLARAFRDWRKAGEVSPAS